jgi:hypothetical protein
MTNSHKLATNRFSVKRKYPARSNPVRRVDRPWLFKANAFNPQRAARKIVARLIVARIIVVG